MNDFPEVPYIIHVETRTGACKVHFEATEWDEPSTVAITGHDEAIKEFRDHFTHNPMGMYGYAIESVDFCSPMDILANLTANEYSRQDSLIRRFIVIGGYVPTELPDNIHPDNHEPDDSDQGAGLILESADAEQFVKATDGTINFGFISPDIAKVIHRQAGPIRMRRGNAQSGEEHINRPNRLKEIQSHGYSDAKSIAESLAKSYNAIYKGKGRSLLLVKKEGRVVVGYVQLEPSEDGGYYDIKSALISRADFLKNKELLWERAQSFQTLSGSLSAVSGQSSPSADSLTSQKEKVKQIFESAELSGAPATGRHPIFERGMVADYRVSIQQAHSFNDIEDVFASMFGPAVVKRFLFGEISELENQIKAMRAKAAEVAADYDDGDEIHRGEKTTAFLNDNSPIELQYAVIEADRLITSHTDEMSLNKDFSQDLQPRDRAREGMKLQVDQMAGKLNPERLGESSSVTTGAPIIGPDLTVESGNGRTIAIRKAYALGDKGQEYKQWLILNADQFGVSAKTVEGMDRPVLVRIRLTEINRAEFARKANEDEIAQMAPTELAKADAAKLTDDDIALFQPSEDGNIAAATNRAFIGRFIEKMGANASTGYMTKDGGYTKQLIDRIQAAIFQKAYQDDFLLALMAEEADPKIKNILGAMTIAAGEFSRAKAIDQGLMGIDIPHHVIEAAKLIMKSREDNLAIEVVLAQGGLFEDISEDTKQITLFIDKNIRSARRMGEVFKESARLLREIMIDEKEPKLMDTGETLPTAARIVARSIDKEKEGREGTGLFESAGDVLMVLTGKELGENIDSGNSVESARNYFKAKMQGKTVMRPGVGDIRFSGKGWKKFKRGITTDIKKAKLLPAAPVVIQHGRHSISEAYKERSDSIVKFHFFDGKIELEDEILLVGVTVGEDEFGHLFYNLNHDPDVLIEKRKAPILPRVEARGSGPLGEGEENPDHGLILRPPDGKVKNIFESAGKFDWRTAINAAASFDEIFSVFERIFPAAMGKAAKAPWKMTVENIIGDGFRTSVPSTPGGDKESASTRDGVTDNILSVSPEDVNTIIVGYMTKIRKARTPEQKAALWFKFLDDGGDKNKLLQEMVLSLPPGHYKLHGREYGTNITDTMFDIYGTWPSNHLSEELLLGLQAKNPAKVYATFTHDMDAIQIYPDTKAVKKKL